MTAAALPKESMQSVISRVVPNVTVRDVRPSPSLRSQRLFDVRISDGSDLLLALPPPLMVKLLRSEQSSISSEAAVLNWLAGLGLNRPLLHGKPSGLAAKVGSPQQEMSPSAGNLVDDGSPRDVHILHPVLLAHSTPSNEYGIEYNVLRSTPGVPISAIQPPLSPAERRIIDLRTGQFCRRLCGLVSPSGRFGPASAVLPSWSSAATDTPGPPASRDANSRMQESQGVRGWAMAFHSMLEAVLRDGEDMAVMLGYASVRRHFKRWEYTLDNVLTPRLVAVDAGNELNTLVIRRKNLARAHQGQQVPSDDDDPYDTDDTGDTRASDSSDDDGHESDKSHTEEDVDVTGMKDWSNFIFGDPLFAVVFSNDPSEDLLEGFYSRTKAGSRWKTNHPNANTSLVDDEETAPIRLLLYGCYHTITQIVKEFYRPQRDSGRRELAARKRLTHILAKLDALGVEADARDRATATPPPPPSPRNRLRRSRSPDDSDHVNDTEAPSM